MALTWSLSFLCQLALCSPSHRQATLLPRIDFSQSSEMVKSFLSFPVLYFGYLNWGIKPTEGLMDSSFRLLLICCCRNPWAFTNYISIYHRALIPVFSGSGRWGWGTKETGSFFFVFFLKNHYLYLFLIFKN